MVGEKCCLRRLYGEILLYIIVRFQSERMVLRTMKLQDALLIKGDSACAFRDPAAVYHNGVFYLYYTYVERCKGGPYLYLAMQTSKDLAQWSERRLLTPGDKRLNYSSPGNIVRFNDEWIICFQTYCRENGEKYGNDNCRLFIMRSKDLLSWSEPELLRVKGPDVPVQDMGRMIDPYLLNAGGEWWCFFKQNGVSFSKSRDLITWEYVGRRSAGENACVVPYKNGFRMFSSPKNGIRVMDSEDLVTWKKAMPDLTLGQDEWDWAKGRITAGFVMENREYKLLPPYLMFFHASRYTEAVEFDSNASIGIAFSDDLESWYWPNKQ